MPSRLRHLQSVVIRARQRAIRLRLDLFLSNCIASAMPNQLSGIIPKLLRAACREYLHFHRH
jgi:hypothetical protein